MRRTRQRSRVGRKRMRRGGRRQSWKRRRLPRTPFYSSSRYRHRRCHVASVVSASPPPSRPPERKEKHSSCTHFSVTTKQSSAMLLLVWSCKTIWCQLMDKNLSFTLFTHTHHARSWSPAKDRSLSTWFGQVHAGNGYSWIWWKVGGDLKEGGPWRALGLELPRSSWRAGCLWTLHHTLPYHHWLGQVQPQVHAVSGHSNARRAEAVRRKSFGEEPRSLATSHQARRATPGKSKWKVKANDCQWIEIKKKKNIRMRPSLKKNQRIFG